MSKLSQFKQETRQLNLDEVMAEIEAEEVRNVIIIGGTRKVAYERLQKMVPDDGIISKEWYDKVETDDAHYMAFSGGPDDVDNVCWMRNLGAHRIAEIILVDKDSISEEILMHVNYVRSANRS